MCPMVWRKNVKTKKALTLKITISHAICYSKNEDTFFLSCSYTTFFLRHTIGQYNLNWSTTPLKNPFWLKWFFMLVLSAQKACRNNLHDMSACCHPVGLILQTTLGLLVFLTSQWITKHSKQRNISESVKLRWSCFPRVALRRISEAGSHFYCEAYARAIRILSPGPKMITSSQCDRNRLFLCWQWASAATSVSFCMFRLEWSWNSGSRDPNQWKSRPHSLELCLYLSSSSRHA